MLSASNITFKSPLPKRKVTYEESQISEPEYQVSFRSILRIRPLIGSEVKEHDNNILSVESQKALELQLPKTPFNSPFPKSLPIGAKTATSHSDTGDDLDRIVVLRPPSSFSFPSLPFPSSSASAKTCVKSVKKYAAGQLTAIAGNEDRFQFDNVFDAQCTQQQFYESVGSGIVSDVISPLLSQEKRSERNEHPRSHVVFSLGVSNSGKSYTLFGKNHYGSTTATSPREEGLVVLMIEHLFSFFEQDVNSSSSSGSSSSSRESFGISLSMMELHNEQVHDMLDPARSQASTMRSASPLRIHQHPETETFFVPGLTTLSYNGKKAAQNALFDAMKTAQVRATPQNATSSRSHVIISIHPFVTVGEDAANSKHGGKIMIFDLAGVERTKKSVTNGVSLKESISINTSIKGVMSCLRALKWNQEHTEKKKIVPYRESKVTMLLQPLFSGKSGFVAATMIVSAYPGASDYAEKRYLLKEVSALRSLAVTEGVTDKLKDWIANTPLQGPNLRIPIITSTLKKRKESDGKIENLLEEKDIEILDLKRQCEDLKIANSSLRQLLKEAYKNKCEQNKKGELYYPETDEAKTSRHRLQSLVPSPLRNHILESATNNNSWICVPSTHSNKAPFQLTAPYTLESDEFAIEASESKENIDIGAKRQSDEGIIAASISTRQRKKPRKNNGNKEA